VTTSAKKGHWPRHKPRHPETATLTARKQLVRLRRFFRRHREVGRSNPVSLRAAAVDIGVSDRALRRWLNGKANPAPAHLRALVEWRAKRPED
jgi:transcriptional regulator with XRE-family HTH domain